ncbi:MAG: hypothetical protein AAF690_24330 [Acidobacteriota bacterium]
MSLDLPLRRCALLACFAVLAALLHLPVPAAAQTQFLGDEFIVNDPAGSDSFPSAASNAAGTSVVAWHCTQPSVEVCARRVSLTGRPAGPEFIVNTTSDSVQQFADVAIDEDGSFFIVWESNAGEDGDDWSILGRLYGPNGEAQTPEMVLNAGSESRQRDPAVAWQPGLGWVVVWDSIHEELFPEVYVRRFRADGSPRGPETKVSVDAPGINLDGLNINAAVSTDADGNFVVAWQGPRLSGGSEVYARRYRADGAAQGPTFRVATQQPSQKWFPGISLAPDGRFAIIFSRTDETIAVRRYGANGQPIGAEFQVNQGPASTTAASIAMADDGSFTAAWTAAINSVTTGSFSVMQRVYDENGSPVEAEQVVAPRGQTPDLAVDGAGDVLAAFHGTAPNAAVRLSQTRTGCVSSETAVCVQDDRFKVEVAWTSANGDAGVGRGSALTGETSIFWFFDPANIELAVKNLDACAINDSFWVFAAGATDVEVDLGVTDTELGTLRSFFNPVRSPFETVRSTSDFACTAARAASGAVPRPASKETSSATLHTLSDRAAKAQCADANDALCLNQSRFRTTVRYTTSSGQTGAGQAIPLSADSGYFWFFDSGNVEILVKVLDACGFNQRFWVFAAGLTDLAIELEVEDTDTGQVRRYTSSVGEGFGPVIDTSAFATCS